MCKIYIIFVFTSDCIYVYTFCPVDPWISEHKISMVTTQETGIECKLLEGQEKLDILNMVDAT